MGPLLLPGSTEEADLVHINVFLTKASYQVRGQQQSVNNLEVNVPVLWKTKGIPT